MHALHSYLRTYTAIPGTGPSFLPGRIADDCDDCGTCGLSSVLTATYAVGDYVVTLSGYGRAVGPWTLNATVTTPANPDDRVRILPFLPFWCTSAQMTARFTLQVHVASPN